MAANDEVSTTRLTPASREARSTRERAFGVRGTISSFSSLGTGAREGATQHATRSRSFGDGFRLQPTSFVRSAAANDRRSPEFSTAHFQHRAYVAFALQDFFIVVRT